MSIVHKVLDFQQKVKSLFIHYFPEEGNINLLPLWRSTYIIHYIIVSEHHLDAAVVFTYLCFPRLYTVEHILCRIKKKKKYNTCQNVYQKLQISVCLKMLFHFTAGVVGQGVVSVHSWSLLTAVVMCRVTARADLEKNKLQHVANLWQLSLTAVECVGSKDTDIVGYCKQNTMHSVL